MSYTTALHPKMKKVKTKIPEFKNIKEEALFWDTHSIADFMDETKRVDAIYAPKKEAKEAITIRMAPSVKREVEKRANLYDISPSTLIRMWVVGSLRKATY